MQSWNGPWEAVLYLPSAQGQVNDSAQEELPEASKLIATRHGEKATMPFFRFPY